MPRIVLTALALCLAAPVTRAQATVDLVGSWELVAAENGPAGADIVFARFVFDDGRLRTTTVYLDADSGRLRGELADDRYRWSDGQILVEDASRVTVLDLARDGDALTVRDVRTGLTLVLRAVSPGLALDVSLLGHWRSASTLDKGGAADTREFVFRPDGSVVLTRTDGEVDVDDYVVAGPYLLIDSTAYRYAMSGGRLTIAGRGEPIVLSRVDEDAGRER